MKRAWSLFYKFNITFAEALHRAWEVSKSQEINAKRIEESKKAAGVDEETRTWAEWKSLGFEVIHGSAALFGVDLIWASKGDGKVYKARFFGKSQVQAIA